MLSIFLLPFCFDRVQAQEREPSLEPVSEHVWVHKSYEDIEPWGLVLSQGLFIRAQDQVIMVDTAWNDRDTEKLFELSKEEFGELPNHLILTHAHRDKMGGMVAAHRLNPSLRSYAHPLTQEDAPTRGLQAATHTLSDWPKELSSVVEVYYPGPGHARDNIVVYHGHDKVLFGGCLVRPGESSNLGNTTDASVNLWADTVENVLSRYGRVEVVVPSHGPKGARSLLNHTIELANNFTLTTFWRQLKASAETKNTATLAELYSEQAKLMTLAGGELEGRESIQNFWLESLPKLGPKATLDWQLVEIRQTSPTTATIHGQWTTENAELPSGYPTFGYFLNEVKRSKDEWKVERAYFWPVTEGHTRHLRPKVKSL